MPWIICSGTILLHLRHSFSRISRVGDWLKLQFPLFFVIPIVFNCAGAPNPAVIKALINGCQSCGRRPPLSLPGPSAKKCVRPCVTRVLICALPLCNSVAADNELVSCLPPRPSQLFRDAAGLRLWCNLSMFESIFMIGLLVVNLSLRARCVCR